MKAKTKQQLVEENARLLARISELEAEVKEQEEMAMGLYNEKVLIEDQSTLQTEEMSFLAEIVDATRPHANDVQLTYSMRDEWLNARKKKQTYAVIGTYSDVVTRLQGYVVSNGGTQHLVHRSHRNKRTWTCNCKVGQKGYCCDAQAFYMAWANKEANAKREADEAKAALARSEAVTIRNDTGPRLYR